MIGARIKCDQCNFIGEMEFKRESSSTAVAPAGWATVSATIRIKGERQLSRKDREEMKAKIKAMTPPFHVCPGCIFGGYAPGLQRLLSAGAS